MHIIKWSTYEKFFNFFLDKNQQYERFFSWQFLLYGQFFLNHVVWNNCCMSNSNWKLNTTEEFFILFLNQLYEYTYICVYCIYAHENIISIEWEDKKKSRIEKEEYDDLFLNLKFSVLVILMHDYTTIFFLI